jgi:hypothetical protein
MSAATRTMAIPDVWTAIIALLDAQMPEVDVDAIGTQDFDEEGELTVLPPAARVMFAGEGAQPFETQAQNYNAAQSFGVICADEDLSADPQQQRLKSVRLATRVGDLLTGARLALPDGSVTEPIIYVKTGPMPTSSTGMAYIAEFLVPGIAQFPAPNAQPQGGQ